MFDSFSPVIPWPWLAVAAAFSIGLAVWSAARTHGLGIGRKCLVALLRSTCLLAVLFILANPQRLRMTERPGPAPAELILVDTSASMALEKPPRIDSARAFADARVKQVGAKHAVRLAEFDAATRFDATAPHPADGPASDLGQALDNVLAGTGRPLPAHVIVVSDGALQEVPRLTRALAEVRRRGGRVSTHVVGSPAILPNVRLSRVRSPAHAGPSSLAEVSIAVEATGFPDGTAVDLTMTSEEQGDLGKKSVTLTGGRGALTWSVPTGLRAGGYAVKIAPLDGEATLADNEATFFISLASRQIKVLYMEGSQTRHPYDGGMINAGEFMTTAFAESGDIECDLFVLPYQDARGAALEYCRGFDQLHMPVRDPSRRLPQRAEDWAGYDVVIVSDIDKATFSAEQMAWVRDLTLQRGAGFCMIGGNLSFDTGRYDQTVWEKLIPVDCTAFGFGHGWRHIRPVFPPGVRSHPILRLDDDPAVRDAMLECHPLCKGYHDVRRLKPGAIALAKREDMEAPLIAVQDYGRGRTMAFLSDAAGGWGEYFQARWGPPALAEKMPPRPLAALLAMARDTSLPPNAFYRRFWVNSMRWLAEKSVRRYQRDLIGRNDEASAVPGKKLPLSAEVRALSDSSRPAEWRVSARLDGWPATRTPLVWDPEAQAFVGDLRVPSEADGTELHVLFDAQWRAQSLTDAVKLPLARLGAELRDLEPGTGLMADIARLGGGATLTKPEDADAVWQSAEKSAADPIRIASMEPRWDHPLLWCLIGALWLAEWALRRRSLMAPGAVAALFLSTLTAVAQEPPAQNPHVLLVFGQPGDDDHEAEYRALSVKMQKILTTQFTLTPDRIKLVAGWKGAPVSSERSVLLETLKTSAAAASEAEPLWIFFFGHSNPTAAGAKYNVPGPDPDERDLAEALKPATGPLVIVHTTSSSGRFTRLLAGKNRVVLSATLPGEEDNETDYGRLLPGVLTNAATDADHDERLSPLEIHRAMSQSVTAHYAELGFIQRESPNLEADGDGRGTQKPSDSDAKASVSVSLPLKAGAH